jgi:hypothetical protein
MTATRVASWIFVAAVCGAWLASASGIARYTPTWREPRTSAAEQALPDLATEVQAQTVRLRDRLAHAPAPAPGARNPFTFAERPRPRARIAMPPPSPAPSPTVPDVREPSLALIGLAERKADGGVTRTALLAAGENDLIMAKVGDRLLGRYEVLAVSVDAVELRDLETSLTRRLALR